MKPRMVVSYTGRGLKITLCGPCEDELRKNDMWPRGTDGQEAVDVYRGARLGYCHSCYDKEASPS